MSLLSLVILLCVLGFGLYMLNKYAPLDGKIKMIINVVVVICAVCLAASAFGLCNTGIANVRVPQLSGVNHK